MSDPEDSSFSATGSDDHGLKYYWIVGCTITAVWLLVIAVFVCTKNVITLPANEIGDTLAGLFSPLILIWFVIATLMQRKELEMQRNELRLQRMEHQRHTTEFIESRKLTERIATPIFRVHRLTVSWERELKMATFTGRISTLDKASAGILINIETCDGKLLTPNHVAHVAQLEVGQELPFSSSTDGLYLEKPPSMLKLKIKSQVGGSRYFNAVATSEPYLQFLEQIKSKNITNLDYSIGDASE